jgi:hypothetical protein
MASILRKSLTLLKAPANSIGFQVRTRLPHAAAPAVLVNEAKGTLFSWLSGPARAQASRRELALREGYNLTSLYAQSSVVHYAENLAWIDRLERLFAGLPMPSNDPLFAADIGSGAFQYATALERFLARRGVDRPRTVELMGVELDGHGRYRDGCTRAQHAVAHAALAGRSVHYIVADFLRTQLPMQHVVTLLFPFLSTYPLLQWGLPISHYKPRRLLRRAVATVQPGGYLCVVNQTRAELERLQTMLAELPVRMVREVSFASELVPYAEKTADRVGSIWHKPGI